MLKQSVYMVCICLLLTSGISFAQSFLQPQLKLLFDKEAQYAVVMDSLTANQKQKQYQNSKIVENLKTQKSILYREILEIKSAIYDQRQAEPVWAEGVGEIILDKKKPYEQSKRLALMYARREAMEKGGKIILETMMRMEKFEVTSEEGGQITNKYVEEFRSIIQSKGKVKIIEQDQRGEYGKVLSLKDDDLTKLQVTVRLKMVSMDEYNPFREELKKLDNVK